MKRNKKELLKNMLIYSILFFIVIFDIMYIFGKNGRGFIWSNDALEQHVITLRYFKDIINQFFRTGNLNFFTWKIMGGIDLFSNMAYYIIGDIFSYIFLLFKSYQIETIYNLLVIIRWYFVGITFLIYCFYKNVNSISSLIGTIIYTFSFFSLYWGITHPYFLDALIIFPLVMIGIEKIILEDKAIFYTIIITLTFLNNFYFAYSIALVIAIYGLALIFYNYKNDGFKKIFQVISKTFFYSMLGILMSSFILIPTIANYLTSERSLSANIYPYSLSYYRNIFNSILSSGISAWIFIGVQSIVFITLPSFIRKRKENYPLFILMLTLIIPLLISQIGSIFSGFSFPSNRWVFVLIFIFAFITTLFINNLKEINKKDIINTIIFLLLYLGINFIFDISLTSYLKIELSLIAVYIAILLFKDKIKIKQFNLYPVCLILFLLIGVLSSTKYLYEESNYTSKFVENGKLPYMESTLNNRINDFSGAIDYIKENDNSFYKISKSYIGMHNISLIKDFDSINGYYSITPNLLSSLSLDLDNLQYGMSRVTGEFDYRTKITTLFGTKYYINNNNIIPYGYSEVKDYNMVPDSEEYIVSLGTSTIYQNDYYLPFGNLYTNYITMDEYELLNSLEKESSLLKNVALEREQINEDLTHGKNNYNDIIKEIDYEIIDENNLLKDNKIIVTDALKNSFKLSVDELNNSEVYIYIENLKYEPFCKDELIDINLNKGVEYSKLKKRYKWYSKSYYYDITAEYKNIIKKYEIDNYLTSPYYVERPNALFNFGYIEESNDNEFKIKLSQMGTYTFDAIKVFAVSMDDYKEDIDNLKRANFEVVDYKDGYLKANVNIEQKGILQFSTMFDKGFKVYVDDKEVNTFKVNKYFLGINIEEGSHSIFIEYNNPYLKLGIIVSFVSLLTFIGINIYKIKLKNNELNAKIKNN